MSIFNTELYGMMKKSKDDVYKIIKDQGKPTRQESAKSFLERSRYAVKLILEEKEIIIFSIAQVIVIAIVYYIFMQVLYFIPDEVWKSAKYASDNASTVGDIVLTVWVIICIGIAAFPIGILSGAIAAAHFLRRTGKESTIASCLRIALSSSKFIWFFSWIDGWLTVKIILERLPKENDKRTTSQKLASEMFYYAWKLLTLGIIPALIAGQTPINACKESVALLKHKTKEIILLRLGYSFFCWIIGILAYIFGVIFLAKMNVFDNTLSESTQMIRVFAYAGVPVIFATAIVQIFLRPIYLISACDIYSDFLHEKGEVPQLGDGKGYQTTIFLFILLCAIAFIGYRYADELGIKKMLATPYTEPPTQQINHSDEKS